LFEDSNRRGRTALGFAFCDADKPGRAILDRRRDDFLRAVLYGAARPSGRPTPTSTSTRLLAMGDPIREAVERVPETGRQIQLVAAAYGRENAATFVGSYSWRACHRRS
jgi:hypothetical protein